VARVAGDASGTRESRQRETTSLELVEFWARTFSGPLPPPETLGQYNEVVPGAAERIVTLAERQASHRQELERAVVMSGVKNERFGQILAGVIAMTGIIVGGVLVYFDKSVAGFAAMLAPLATMTAAFFYGKRQQQKRLTQKREVLSDSLRRPAQP
jgi:uncharacterized membrane protein